MCGIVGAWIKTESAAALEAVGRAVSLLNHRGPDDLGMVQIETARREAQLVLGHTRLSIIDLTEGGHQPMFDPAAGNWIIYNGEVFNFAEMRAELESEGCCFRSNSDTEVLLQSYRVWGRACVSRWRGMFAAAIWDNARQELFLVRDRLGIKPLYYSYEDGRLVFASELKVLLASGLVQSRKINLAALDTYLMFGAVQDPLTIIDGVLSLPAAHTLRVGEHGLQLEEYWELPLARAEEQTHRKVDHERLGSLLEEAVRLRLVSDVPLGVFLSGGIDSSAVAMLMRRASAEQVRAFTISFADKNFDEEGLAQETARRLGVEHHPILLTESEMLDSYADALKAMDQPSMDGVNTFYVSRAVKRAGMTVALSGLGGDEAFGGYPHFRTIPRLERFSARFKGLPFPLRRAGARLLKMSDNGRNAKLRALLLDDYGFNHPYFLSRTLFLPDQIASLFQTEAIRAIEYGQWAERMRLLDARARQLDQFNRISYFEFKTYIANTLLRDTDAMSMAHSLEVRVPLLDHLLLEELMRLPGSVKLDSRLPKPLLVRSLPESLPSAVTHGPKRGFVLPYARWLPGKLREEVEESFRHPPSALDEMLDAEAVWDVWRSFLAGRCSWTRPWSLFVLYEVVRRLVQSPAASLSYTESYGLQAV
ncbi:MAG TPA: asparagine synthase (glutamine-hydrolyzing) [Pyrinomonadaceae bacterium]|jgi:asparagine synthase (glutamine-hydrolysing)